MTEEKKPYVHKAPWLKQYYFKKGQVANPSGGNKQSKEFKKLKKMGKEKVALIIGKYLDFTRKDLKHELKHNEELTVHETIVISIMLKAWSKGDQVRLNFLYERTIGKVKDELEVSEGHGELMDYIKKAKDE